MGSTAAAVNTTAPILPSGSTSSSRASSPNSDVSIADRSSTSAMQQSAITVESFAFSGGRPFYASFYVNDGSAPVTKVSYFSNDTGENGVDFKKSQDPKTEKPAWTISDETNFDGFQPISGVNQRLVVTLESEGEKYEETVRLSPIIRETLQGMYSKGLLNKRVGQEHYHFATVTMLEDGVARNEGTLRLGHNFDTDISSFSFEAGKRQAIQQSSFMGLFGTTLTNPLLSELKITTAAEPTSSSVPASPSIDRATVKARAAAFEEALGASAASGSATRTMTGNVPVSDHAPNHAPKSYAAALSLEASQRTAEADQGEVAEGPLAQPADGASITQAQLGDNAADRMSDWEATFTTGRKTPPTAPSSGRQSPNKLDDGSAAAAAGILGQSLKRAAQAAERLEAQVKASRSESPSVSGRQSPPKSNDEAAGVDSTLEGATRLSGSTQSLDGGKKKAEEQDDSPLVSEG